MDQILERVKEYAAKAKIESAKLGKQAYDKANSTIASTKLSFAINETDSKIKEAYQAIGKIVYDKYLADGEADELVKEACESIDELYKEKFILKEKKAELKKSVACTECGEYNKADAAYCSSCGAKLTGTDVDAEVSATDEEDDMIDKVMDKAEDLKDKAEDVVEAVKSKIPEDLKDKAEDIMDKMEDAADVIEEKVKKVIKIKPRKPADE